MVTSFLSPPCLVIDYIQHLSLRYTKALREYSLVSIHPVEYPTLPTLCYLALQSKAKQHMGNIAVQEQVQTRGLSSFGE